MSSKPRDQGTMSSASSGAQAADQALAASATQNQAFTNNARKSLFGSADGSSLTGGTLSKFLDPSSLNVSGPTGTYGLQYNKAVENIANQSAQTRGSLSRYNASRGFGTGPAGFAADEQRKAGQDQVTQQGAAFTDLAGKSYQDALQNFWRASGSLSGEGDSALSAAIGADSSAANNYANLYGTASTPRPSVLGPIIGGGLQAGGQIGSAAAACPCEGQNILMQDGTEKLAEDVRIGDEFRGIDGAPCRVKSPPRKSMQPCVEIHSFLSRNGAKVSASHSFVLQDGGYENAKDVRGHRVRFKDSYDNITRVNDLRNKTVYEFDIGGSHSYCVEGFWSLS